MSDERITDLILQQRDQRNGGWAMNGKALMVFWACVTFAYVVFWWIFFLLVFSTTPISGNVGGGAAIRLAHLLLVPLLGTLVVDDGNDIWVGATTNHVFGAVTNEFKNGINVTEDGQ